MVLCLILVLVVMQKGSEHFWDVYRLFNIQSLTLKGIYLPAMWVQIPKLLGLFFVVAFGSSFGHRGNPGRDAHPSRLQL